MMLLNNFTVFFASLAFRQQINPEKLGIDYMRCATKKELTRF